MPKRKLRVLKNQKKTSQGMEKELARYWDKVWKEPVAESMGENEVRLRVALEEIMRTRTLTEEQESLLEEIKRVEKNMQKIGENKSLTESQKMDLIIGLNAELGKKIGHLEATLRKARRG